MSRIKYLTLLICISLVSCVFDNRPLDIDKGDNVVDETDYNVSLSFGEAGIIQTKSTENDALRESNISKLDLLFFDHGTGLFKTLSSSVSVVNVTGKGMARILLPYEQGASNVYDIIAVANVPLTAADYQGLLAGKNVLQAKELIKKESSSKPSSNIMMSGEYSAPVTLSSDSDMLTFRMQRSVARIDVKATRASVAAKFTLMTAETWNVRDKGFAFPSDGNTHIPADAAIVHYQSYSSDDRDDDPANPGAANRLNQITGKLYCYENSTGSVAQIYETTCLIIGGLYTDAYGVKQMGYYRLDIGYSDSGTLLYDVKRNTNYQVNITDVTGVGYATKEEAYEGKTQNVVYDISDWEAFNMGGITFDGKRSISLSTCLLELGRNSMSTAHTVKVRTDNIYFGDWNVVPVRGTSWCTVDDLFWATDGGQFTVKITQNLPDGTPSREAVYRVFSGSVSVLLTVRQSTIQDIGITYTPEVVSVPPLGFPEFTGGTPVDGALIKFEFSGLADLNATYDLHVVGEAAEWCRVKDNDTAELNPSGKQVHLSNYFVLEADPLSIADSYRDGYVAVDVYHDATVSNYVIPLHQNTYLEILTAPKATRLGMSAGATSTATVASNCAWYTDWGLASVNNWIYDNETGLSYAENTRMGGEKRITFIHDEQMLAFVFSKVTFFSKNNGTELASTVVYCGCADISDSRSTEAVYLNGTFQTAGTYKQGIGWGCADAGSLYCDFRKDAWNAGTPDNPIKGENDPCPDGWRMLTKKEAQDILDYGYLFTGYGPSGYGGTYWLSDLDDVNHKMYVLNLRSNSYTSTIRPDQSRIIEVDYDPAITNKSNYILSTDGSLASTRPSIRCIRYE